MSTDLRAAAVVYRRDDHDRQALADRPELVVVEKCGEQEQPGGGLADDIVAVIAEGLPTLVLVPAEALDDWRELTGGELPELPCEREALRCWWRAPSGTV